MYSGGAVAYAAYGEGGYPMSPTEILLDAFFAAVAGTGFGTISDPPANALPRIACLAAVGHALRFVLMHWGMDIATASFIAGFAIGSCSLILARQISVPMTILYIPALLPMIPGIYAYKTVFSLIMFLQSLGDTQRSFSYIQSFFLNATVSTTVVAFLGAGAALPTFIFKKLSHALSRPPRNS